MRPAGRFGSGMAGGLATTAAVAAMMASSGCARGPRVQRIHGDEFGAAYSASIDRLVHLGLHPRTNMLWARDLKLAPDPGGNYRFYGGQYSWISPDPAWTESAGDPSLWSPQPEEDRGPTLVTRQSGRLVRAEGPITPSGLREAKMFSFDDEGDTVHVAQGLTNEADEPRSAGVWSVTAVPPRAIIAIPKPTHGDIIVLGPDGEAIWSKVAKEDGNWITLNTMRFHWWARGGGAVAALVPSEPIVAYWSRGYWLLRVGAPFDEAGTLWEAGHAPVQVRLDYARKAFEAHLLGPIVELQPGETTVFVEHWMLIKSDSGSTAALDRALARMPTWSMDPADEFGGIRIIVEPTGTLEMEETPAAPGVEPLTPVQPAIDVDEPAPAPPDEKPDKP